MKGVRVKVASFRTTVLVVVLSGLPTGLTWAATNTRADIADGKQLDKINSFNIGPYQTEHRSAYSNLEFPTVTQAGSRRSSVGSAQSPNAGIGVGVSVDLTWDDAQWNWGAGRRIDHWWNGAMDETMEASVHFAYTDMPDSVTGYPYSTTGYNVYDAVVTSGNWPRGQDIGCDLQAADTMGAASSVSLAITANGRAVISSLAQHFRSYPSGTRLYDNFIYYQGAEFNCTYDPRSNLNVTWVDSTVYRPLMMQNTYGTYSRDPQVATQWDGTNTIVHLLLGERSASSTDLSGDDYVTGLGYYTWTYFRKVGSTSAGTWSSGKIIDSIWFPWTEIAAAPYPNSGVAVVYTNPSYYGALLDNGYDLDVWCRESYDRGVTWYAAYSVTDYQNAIAGHPNHFTAWLEAGCMFDSEGDLHVYWTAKPTSADPYFDGYDWQGFDQNLYHWEKTNDGGTPGLGDAIKVANGTFMDYDMLTGSMNTYVCGFGGDNVGYLGWITMGECDNKLYLVWSQIHERANRFPWRDASTQPAPGVLDDCSYSGNRMAMANWELMMSVASMSSSTLWDNARNITNTYTPNCGLAGDPEAERLCGSEWKPSLERQALDETGLSLTWPAASVVDLTPEGQPAYAGGRYLNMEYMDDQFPGPAFWGSQTNPPGTENSMKWIRLACVEPIEASQIAVYPESIEWPEWVELGTSKNFTITVVNNGNVTLNVVEIGTAGGSWLDVSQHPTLGSPFTVTSGVVRTRTFDLIVNAAALSQNQWLDGQIWLKSDAANIDSMPLLVHVLAAANVENIRWDTVTTHQNMFDPFFEPVGACVALAVGNNGEFGWGAGSSGRVNLDYSESGLECGTRERDAFYLASATPFTIMATNSSGTGSELTQVTNDPNQADETGFDPTPYMTITGGQTASGKYDSVYTGKFVNRDTTIAMERIVYGPRSATPQSSTLNFVVALTKVYSADGAAHNHVTVGNVCDWDVPSDSAPYNTTGISSAGFLYVQGTDTVGHTACQQNVTRYATEAFGGGYTKAQYNADQCTNDPNAYFGVNAASQLIMVDTTHYRNGTPLVPAQPNPTLWWDITSVPGLNADAMSQDQALWLTYKQDYNLIASDTLYYWTVLSTVRNGSLADLESQVAYAKTWYRETVRGCEIGCCNERVGNSNGDGGEMPTIGDISVMIDAKFITSACIESGLGANIKCLGEADMNLSGGSNPACCDITLVDISMLVDDLFLTREPPYVRNLCASDQIKRTEESLARPYLGVISIDDVSNQISPTQLRAGSTHTVSLRYDFRGLTGPYRWQTSNAYEVYSPDGADWVDLLRGDGPLMTTLGQNVARFRKYYTSTDNGVHYTRTAANGAVQPGGSSNSNSRAAYSIVVVDVDGTDGFVGGVSNGIAVTLEFQTRLADVGRHMCIDTTNSCDMVAWEWASASQADYPQWDNGLGVSGPRCFELVDSLLAPLGDADITREAECAHVGNIGSSGNDGARVFPSGDGSSGGIRTQLENVLLDNAGDGIHFKLHGYVSEPGKSELSGITTLQEVGMAGVTNVNGQIQITANFNPIGDPNVEFRAWVLAANLMTGLASVPGGGVIAQGTAVSGSASVVNVSQLANNPPSFSIRFDRPVQFTLATNPPVQLAGDEIHLVATNATSSIAGLGPADVTGEYIGWFGMCGIKTDACCLGFVGNANMDPTDAVTIGDISVLIDNLFISGVPLNCLEEADVNRSGTLLDPPLGPEDITIGDISILIDHLFVSQLAVSLCP